MNIDERIEQCKKDLAAIQANLEKLKAEKEQKEQKWIIATSKGDRAILNLSALSESGKISLSGALKDNLTWISFTKEGFCGTYSLKKDGLSYYVNTRVVF